MNERKLKRLKRLANIVDNGEIAIAEEISLVEDKIDHNYEELSNGIGDVLVVALEKQKGDPGEKGDKGDDGTIGRDGSDGKDGRDGHDGRDGIDGRDGRDGIDGLNGKDGSPDTSEQIRDKLGDLKDDDRLDASAIKGIVDEKRLEDEIKTLQNRTQLLIQIATQRNSTSTSAGGYTVETPTGALYSPDTGTGGTTFTVTATPVYIVADGITYFEGAGYSVTMLTVTMDTPVTQYIRSFHQ